MEMLTKDLFNKEVKAEGTELTLENMKKIYNVASRGKRPNKFIVDLPMLKITSKGNLFERDIYYDYVISKLRVGDYVWCNTTDNTHRIIAKFGNWVLLWKC